MQQQCLLQPVQAINYFSFPGLTVAQASEVAPEELTIRQSADRYRSMLSALSEASGLTVDEVSRLRYAIEAERNKLITQVEMIVCAIYDQPPLSIRTKCRKRELVLCRQIIMTIAMEPALLKMSTTAAGAIYFKDHATAIHAQKCIRNLYQTDKAFRFIMADLCSELNIELGKCKFLAE